MSQGAAEVLLRGAERRRGPERQPEVPPRRTRRQTVAALQAVPLFTSLSRRHLERLAKETDEQRYGAGERIVEEGMLGETLFIVLEGRAKVLRGTRKVASVLPGEFFGELSTIDGGPRTATIVAETPVRVIRLFRRSLLALVRDEPRVAMHLLEGIARRIREIDRRLR